MEEINQELEALKTFLEEQLGEEELEKQVTIKNFQGCTSVAEWDV